MILRHLFIIVVITLSATCFCSCGGTDKKKPTSDEKTAQIGATEDTDTVSASEPKAGEKLEEAGKDQNTIDRGNRPPKTEPIVETLSAPVFPIPGPDEMVDIPAGTFTRGSSPADDLRDQFAENDHIDTPMTAFQMDKLPWPNDPAMEYLTDIPRAEARAMCESQGKRLCTELEMEYACKGDDNRRYISGNIYKENAYTGSNGSPSPYGVWGLGTLLELTGSIWGKEPDQQMRMAVRGYAPHQEFLGNEVSPAQGRRCAKRWRFDLDAQSMDVGFRCCKGPVNKATCFIERPRPAHSRYKTLKPDEFARIIRSIPELEAVHDNPHMFSNADIRAIMAKRGTDRKALERQGIHFQWKPLRWIPSQGMELWVAVGRSDRHSFIVALHEIEDGTQYEHESSMIIWDNPIPLAIAYREGHRNEIYWAPCWRCRDGGILSYNEKNNEIIISDRW